MSILGRFKFGTTKAAVAIDLAVVPTLAVFFDEKYLPYASLTKRRPELDRLVFNKHMRKTLGHLPLDALTTQVLDDWVMEHLTKGYKPGTINKHINYLNRILNVARNWGLISGNKERTRVSRKIPMGDQRQRFLSEPERDRLLAACKASSVPSPSM